MQIRTFLLLLLCLPAFTGCRNKKSAPVLEDLYRLTAFRPAPDTRAVVILADNSCMECNRELSDVMRRYLTRKDIQFVISVHESAMDISPYLQSPRKDLVFDYDHRLTDSRVVRGSTILFLKDGELDTSIQVDATRIRDQLAFLQARLGR